MTTSQNQKPHHHHHQLQSHNDELNTRLNNMSISFSIWPPTQRTREAVTNRLIQTLTSPSLLSNRYGSLSREEASATARSIEEQSFSIATASSTSSPPFSDGFDTLQLYSKEISKRMLEAVKSRGGSSVSSAPSEEISSK